MVTYRQFSLVLNLEVLRVVLFLFQCYKTHGSY